MIVPRTILFRLLRGTLFLWIAVRTAGLFVGIGSFLPHEMMIVALLVLLLIWVDIRAFREAFLFANLAISPLNISGIVLLVALVLDLTLWLTIGGFIRNMTSP